MALIDEVIYRNITRGLTSWFARVVEWTLPNWEGYLSNALAHDAGEDDASSAHNCERDLINTSPLASHSGCDRHVATTNDSCGGLILFPRSNPPCQHFELLVSGEVPRLTTTILDDGLRHANGKNLCVVISSKPQVHCYGYIPVSTYIPVAVGMNLWLVHSSEPQV